MGEPAYILSMDTILYIFQKNGIKEPEVEPAGQKSYMLIRVAVDVREEEWLGVKTGRERAAGMPEDSGEPSAARRRFFLPGFLRSLGAARRQRRREERLAAEREEFIRAEEQRLAAEQQERIRYIRHSVSRLSREVLELAGEWTDCYLAYEDRVKRWLAADESGLPESGQQTSESSLTPLGYMPGRQKRILPSLWKESFPVPEFRQYTKQFWVELLLSQAVLPHFVILGKAPCMYPLLGKLACRMKSLCWILESTGCDQELVEFVEDFYEEYGLAVTLQLFEPLSRTPWRAEGEEAMRRLRLREGPAANIIDFTKEPHIAVTEAAPGSIWLDMMSVEEKQRRIRAKGIPITCFSLKAKWRRAQKRCKCPVLP